MKGNYILVFIGDSTLNFLGNDPTEDAVLHCFSPPRPYPRVSDLGEEVCGGYHRQCCMMSLKNPSLVSVRRSWSMSLSVAVVMSTWDKVLLNLQTASRSCSV